MKSESSHAEGRGLLEHDQSRAHLWRQGFGYGARDPQADRPAHGQIGGSRRTAVSMADHGVRIHREEHFVESVARARLASDEVAPRMACTAAAQAASQPT